MTASVLNSDRAVHPVLGSIYSAATQRRTPENFAEENVISSPTRIESVAMPPEEQSGSSARADLAAPASTASNLREAAIAPLISTVPAFRNMAAPAERAAPKASAGSAAGDRPSFQPLVSKGERRTEKLTVKMNYEDGGVHQPSEAASREVETTSLSASNASSLRNVTSDSGKAKQSEEPASAAKTSFKTVASKTAPETGEKPAAVRQPYQPLVAENLPRLPKLFPEAANAFASDAKREEARRGATRYRGQVEREPDEIQIHIGRIEVVAVPPPAPVREVKPTTKSLSLDDYLKRGNGRAR
jgi:hypothetical protein